MAMCIEDLNAFHHWGNAFEKLVSYTEEPYKVASLIEICLRMGKWNQAIHKYRSSVSHGNTAFPKHVLNKLTELANAMRLIAKGAASNHLDDDDEAASVLSYLGGLYCAVADDALKDLEPESENQQQQKER